MLEVSGLRFKYTASNSPVIDGLDVQLEPGTFLVVTGPSGSGKSTFLRSLNGLIPHFYGGHLGGTVTVNGLDTRMETTATLSAHLGFVGQEPESQTVFDTVVDEVAFGPENLARSASQIRESVDSAIRILGIDHMRERDIFTLSGGERQRVVIAAALAMRPGVLLLDEPLSQLDPWAAQEFLSHLKRLNQQEGFSIVVAEHRIDSLLAIASHTLEFPLKKGTGAEEITSGDSLRRLRTRPTLARLAEAFQWPEVAQTVEHARELAIRHGPALPPRIADARASRSLVASARDVSVLAGNRVILDGVSLDLFEGSVTAVVGANGSGKTTLLRTLAGLQRPAAGVVEVAGMAASEIPLGQRPQLLGFVPQHPAALFLGLSVWEEIQIALGDQWSDQEVSLVLKKFHLSGLAERFSYDISGGERQRLALAIASNRHPHLLILDEPTRGMDDLAIKRLRGYLAQLRDRGVAIVISTHNTELAADCADRIILLQNGQIRADGGPEDVLTVDPALTPPITSIVGNGYMTIEQVESAMRSRESANVRA